MATLDQIKQDVVDPYMGRKASVLKLAVKILDQHRQSFVYYDEACREAAKDGYRPHYCIHGTNQWTDYDNICRPCEDGYGSWDYEAFAKLSLDDAKYRVAQVKEREEVYRKMINMPGRLSDKLKEEMIEWVFEPMDLD